MQLWPLLHLCAPCLCALLTAKIPARRKKAGSGTFSDRRVAAVSLERVLKWVIFQPT
jgi:hypothetical protein